MVQSFTNAHVRQVTWVGKDFRAVRANLANIQARKAHLSALTALLGSTAAARPAAHARKEVSCQPAPTATAVRLDNTRRRKVKVSAFCARRALTAAKTKGLRA